MACAPDAGAVLRAHRSLWTALAFPRACGSVFWVGCPSLCLLPFFFFCCPSILSALLKELLHPPCSVTEIDGVAFHRGADGEVKLWDIVRRRLYSSAK